MSSKTSSPGPPDKSSWLWSGRKRRNSESSLPSLRELVTGRRNSLSTTDVTEVNVLRKKPPRHSTTKSRAPESKNVDVKVAAVAPTVVDSDGAKNTRKSQTRPPPAFFNKVNHRHTFSASAVLRWYTIDKDDEVLLKPPPTRSRTSSTAGPPQGLKPTAASPTLRPPRSRFDGPLAVYRPEEQEYTLRTQRASARTRRPEMEHAPAMRMPTAYPQGPVSGPEPPGGYNKPRRLSNSSASSATSSVLSGPDGFDGRIRTASFSSSQTSIDSSPISPGFRPVSAPVSWQEGVGAQNYPWARPAPIKQRRKAQPGELFAALPGEVLELILEQLRKLHLQPGTTSCATCWIRDCCSVAVSARKFVKYAREALYQHIHLVGHESPNMKKRTKTTYGSRLVLLRRTLRANPHISVIVRSLKPPARPLSVGVVAYNDLIASVVMACPNLERLVGHYPTYDHSFQRLFQALSTRPRLKDMNWILEPSLSQRQQRTRSPAHNNSWGPGELHPQESQLFLGYHSNWKQLTTLVVHCQPGAALSPANLLECTIRSLPSLRNLYLSHVPHTTFNDTNLLSLPTLKKLSLSYCTGVTTAGLSSLATRPTSASLESLTLIHMNIESLPAIARIFSYLTALSTFTVVQTYAPEMPPDEFIMLFPYLASASLRKLHWDIPYLPNTTTPADAILARSISAGGFPSLRSLCTPNDPEGLFQALCIPRERIDHPTDRFRSSGGGTPARPSSARPSSARPSSGVPWGHTHNNSSFSSTRTGGSTTTGKNAFGGFGGGFGSGNTPPASPLFAPGLMLEDDALLGLPRENSNLHLARLAAQARLETAQRVPRWFVNVVDEKGAVVEKFGVGAFLGTVESRIRYVLSPETRVGATDEGGGLVTVEDMIRDDGGEMLGLIEAEGSGKKSRWGGGGRDREAESDAEGAVKSRKEGCCGRWNTYSGVLVDKKDRERWWHQERGRWRGVVLS